MTDFERERLNRYLEDGNHWLTVVHGILMFPKTPAQAAAATLARAALELVAGIRQQMMVDDN